MCPALQAACQQRPSASWHRRTASAGCHCVSTPRNFHNIPTVCRNALRQFARLKNQADGAGGTGGVFCNRTCCSVTFDPCVEEANEKMDQCSRDIYLQLFRGAFMMSAPCHATWEAAQHLAEHAEGSASNPTPPMMQHNHPHMTSNKTTGTF